MTRRQALSWAALVAILGASITAAVALTAELDRGAARAYDRHAAHGWRRP